MGAHTEKCHVCLAHTNSQETHIHGFESSSTPSFSFVLNLSLIPVWVTHSLFVAVVPLMFCIFSLFSISTHTPLPPSLCHLSVPPFVPYIPLSLSLSHSLSHRCRCLTVTLASYGCCSILIWLLCSGADTHMLSPFSWFHFTFFSLLFSPPSMAVTLFEFLTSTSTSESKPIYQSIIYLSE